MLRYRLFLIRHILVALGRWQSHTVAYFFHYEGVEADLIHTLVQTVGLIDLLHLLMKQYLL